MVEAFNKNLSLQLLKIHPILPQAKVCSGEIGSAVNQMIPDDIN